MYEVSALMHRDVVHHLWKMWEAAFQDYPSISPANCRQSLGRSTGNTHSPHRSGGQTGFGTAYVAVSVRSASGMTTVRSRGAPSSQETKAATPSAARAGATTETFEPTLTFAMIRSTPYAGPAVSPGSARRRWRSA